jgi:2-polyprenyl-3-methyl-5-hydroxy-6-metoxy-1,4-benzoquinol methylase
MKTKEKTDRSEQQEQALKFFDEKAKEWGDKAQGKINNKVNVIKQRNDYVLQVIKKRKETRYLLDVGSGVGDLVCEAAKMGINATGIDIAGGMVDLAHRRAVDEKLAMAKFITTDYFDWHVEPESYDLVAANGFIEYISYEQRDNFFSDAFRILKRAGSLVVSSRNRLFNLVSANDYTIKELEEGEVEALLKEVVEIVEGASIEELVNMEVARLQLEETTHADTGIGVGTRYQYTPAQLVKMLYKEGFKVENISPIHIHGGSPKFKERHPDMHFIMANLMQKEAINNWSLIPHASAFMVHARKE